MDLDLAVLLRSLGLERYETAFREKAITEEVLPSVSGGAPNGNFRLQASLGEAHRRQHRQASGIGTQALNSIRH
jgi:hypothetical protein